MNTVCQKFMTVTRFKIRLASPGFTLVAGVAVDLLLQAFLFVLVTPSFESGHCRFASLSNGNLGRFPFILKQFCDCIQTLSSRPAIEADAESPSKDYFQFKQKPSRTNQRGGRSYMKDVF